MKSGANRTDINSIKRMSDNGDDAEHISHALQIHIDVVKSFIPKPKASKSKSKLAEGYSD